MTFFRKMFGRAALASVLLTTAGVASHARASDVPNEERMPRTYAAAMKMKPVEVMHAMDRDGKGYVTHEEFMKFYDQLFQRMDRNHDGKITEPEFTDRG